MLLRTLAWVMCVGCQTGLQAQGPPPAANLATGIAQVKSGEFFAAIVTLNAVVSQLSAGANEAPILARAHAFRAQAYLGLNQPDRAKAAAALALKADPQVASTAGDLPASVLALFEDRIKPGAQNPEAIGDALSGAGDPEGAFAAYRTAHQALTEPLSRADDQRLREKLIKLSRSGVAPVIPDEARAQVTKAQDLLDAEAILGGPPGVASQQAAVALRQAIRLAPWWGDAAFRLAAVLQKLNQVDEALVNLSMYRLADPDGYATRVERAAPKVVADRPAPAAVPRPTGPALIYIYWPEQQRGGGRQKVFCNGHQVAELQNNRFVVLKATPGTHDLAFRDKHVAAVVEAGREYHFRTSIEGHFQFAMGPEVRLTAADAATIEMRKQGMSLNDARRTRSAECAPPAAGRGRPRR